MKYMNHAGHEFYEQTTARYALSSQLKSHTTTHGIPVKPLNIGQEEKRHHSYSTSRKEAQHTALGPSKPLRKQSVGQ